MWTQVSHHWFTTLFSMVTVWAALSCIERTQPRWSLIAGISAGMAVMITPHRGALVTIAAAIAFLFDLRRSLVQLALYVNGCLVVPTILLAYLLAHHAAIAAFDNVVSFTATRYTAVQGVPFGFGAQYVLTYLFPVAALLVFVVYVGDRHNRTLNRILWQSSAFGFAAFAGCFPRPDVAHIAFAVPLLCPLLAHCAARLAQRWHSNWWRYRYLVVLLAGALIGICVPHVVFFLQLSHGVLRSKLIASPRGDVVNIGPLAAGGEELLAHIIASPPTDKYFFYPKITKFGFLTAREQVSKYDVFMAGYTTPSQYNEACISVMQGASWVIIDRRMTDPELLKQHYPAILNAEPPETKRFEQALDRGFELFARYGPFELRQRRRGASNIMCAGIVE
jgi:hypothetical protein